MREIFHILFRYVSVMRSRVLHIFTFSLYKKRKYCIHEKIRIRDFDQSWRFMTPVTQKTQFWHSVCRSVGRSVGLSVCRKAYSLYRSSDLNEIWYV